MIFRITGIVIVCILLISCGIGNSNGIAEERDHAREAMMPGIWEIIKKSRYERRMAEKKFTFERNGPCDDALDAPGFEREVTYIDKTIITDSSAIVEFRFIDACCMWFMGDYWVDSDTLVFEYEQINDEMCLCVCWYRFKLLVNELKTKIKSVKIKAKE